MSVDSENPIPDKGLLHTESEVIADYYRQNRPDQYEVEQQLRSAFDREIELNRITIDRDQLVARSGFRDIRIPLFVIIGSLIILGAGTLLLQRLFDQREIRIRQELASFSSAAEDILEEIRQRNETLLSAKDAQISRFLRQIEELESQRSMLLNEFALSLSQKSTQIENELVFRVEEERLRLRDGGLDEPEIDTRLAEFEQKTENELIQDYLMFRSIKLDRLEAAQDNLRSRQQELRHILDTTTIFSEKELGDLPPAEILPVESERPLPVAEISAQLERSGWITAAYSLDTLLEALYPENARAQLVNQVASAAARSSRPLSSEPDLDSFREEERRRYARMIAYFSALEGLDYFTQSGVEELIRRFARNDRELEEVMRAGAEALKRQLNAYYDTRNYTLLGSVSLILEDSLLIELLGEAESLESGIVRLVRKRNDSPEELIGIGEIVRSRGRSVEVVIKQLFDGNNPPMRLDLAYVKRD